MPKEMFSVQLQRQPGDPWGLVIVGGKDQGLDSQAGEGQGFQCGRLRWAEAVGLLVQHQREGGVRDEPQSDLLHGQECRNIHGVGC